MSRIDHDLEELLLDLFVDSLDHGGGLGCVGEVLKFDPAQKLEMPSFDRAFGQTAFLETAGMNFDRSDCIVKGFSLQLLAGQPFLEGSGGGDA